MSNSAMTINDLGMLLGLVVAVLTLWWRVETRVSGASKEALVKALAVEAELNRYKLEVADNYARNGFIRDVENRIGERFDKIVEELHGMRQDFQKAMVDMAKGNSRRRT